MTYIPEDRKLQRALDVGREQICKESSGRDEAGAIMDAYDFAADIALRSATAPIDTLYPCPDCGQRVLKINVCNCKYGSCSEQPNCRIVLQKEREAREARASLANAPAEPSEARYIKDIIENAMLTMWNEICADTGCHPLDIIQGKGRELEFHRGHWARMTAEMAEGQILKLILPPPPPDAVRSALENAAVLLEVGARYAPNDAVSDKNANTGERLKTRGLADTMQAAAEKCRAAISTPAGGVTGTREALENAAVLLVADQIIADIEKRFPGWQSYRDLVDCIDVTLHNLQMRPR